jgi:hypothetical protein
MSLVIKIGGIISTLVKNNFLLKGNNLITCMWEELGKKFEKRNCKIKKMNSK